MSKRIYIAGKISGEQYHHLTQRFGTIERAIMNDGNEPVCPLNIVDSKEPWPQAMRKCIAALMSCDEAYFLPDWVESPGATLERDICLRVGIKIKMLKP